MSHRLICRVTISAGPIVITATNGLQIGSDFGVTNAANGIFTVSTGEVLNMSDKALQIGGKGDTNATGNTGLTGTLTIASTGSISNAGNITIGGHGGDGGAANAGSAGGAGTLQFANGATAVSWTYNGGTLQVGGIAGTAAGANLGGAGGAGSLILGQHAVATNAGSNGTLTIGAAGILNVNSLGTVQIGGAGGAASNTDGKGGGIGALTIGGHATINDAAAFNVGGAGTAFNGAGTDGGAGGNGALTVSNAGVLTIESAQTAIKIGGAGGAAAAGDAAGSGGTGALTVNAGGTLNLTGAGTIAVQLGGAKGATGITGTDGNGTLTVAGTMNVKGVATTITLLGASNATVSGNGELHVGYDNTAGTLKLVDGFSAGIGLTINAGAPADNAKVYVTSVVGTASELKANTTITQGELHLVASSDRGAIHTGDVTLNGGALVSGVSPAKLYVTGGTSTNPNAIAGNLTTTANRSGTVEVGTEGAAAFLSVSGTANKIGNGTLATAMTVHTGSQARFSNAAGLTIDALGTVTAQALKLQTAATTDAGLVAQVVNINSGGTLHIKGGLTLTQGQLAASALGTGVNLATGGTLRVADVLNITNSGAAVTAAAGGTVIANTLKADAGTQAFTWNGGTLTLLGDSNQVALLASGLTLATASTVNLGSTAAGLVTNGGSYTGALTFTSGTLNVVAGDWTINNGIAAGAALDLGGSGTLAISGGTLNLNVGAANDLTVKKATGLTLSNAGILNLTGNLTTDTSGTITLANASQLHVTGNLNAAVNNSMTVGGTATLQVGGNAIVTGAGAGTGGLYVNGGTATVAGLTDVQALGVVNVASGTLTTGSIQTIVASGLSLVGNGTDQALLKVTGSTAGTSVITANNKIQLHNLGTVEMDYRAVAASTTTAVGGVGTVDANSKTGVLKLVNGPATITIADYNTLKPLLLANGGTLRLENTLIENVADGTALKGAGGVEGIAVPYVNATFTNGDSLATSGTEVKSLTASNAAATTLTVTGTGATLALAGDATNANFKIIDNVNAGAGVTTVTASGSGTLTLGLVGGTATMGTAANTDIVLNAGTLQAVNGAFVVDGTVTETGGGTSTVTVANDTTLQTKAITQTHTASTISLGSNSSLTATATSTVMNVSLAGGTLAATGATSDLTIGSAGTNGRLTSTGGEVNAQRNLALAGLASVITGDTVLTAGGNLTSTANSIDATGTATLTVQAAGNIIAGGKDITTLGGALTVKATAATSDITAQDILAGGGSALTVSAGNDVTARNIATMGALTLTAGNDVTANNITTTGKLALTAVGTVATTGNIAGGTGSALSADTLAAIGNVTLDGGTFNLTSKVAANSIAGNLALGTVATGVKGVVADALTVTGTTTLLNSQLSVDTLTLTGVSKASTGTALTATTLNLGVVGLTVGDIANANDGSTLTATNTNLGGNTLQVLNAKASLGTVTSVGGDVIFVDPAYVNITGFGPANFAGILSMGDTGIITVGSVTEAWVQRAIQDARAPADSSVLGLQSTLTLAGAGKVVVDNTATATGSIGVIPVADQLYFGDKSLLVLDGTQFTDPTVGKAAIVGTGGIIYTNNVAGTDQAKLHIVGAQAGKTVYVASGLTLVDVAPAAIDNPNKHCLNSARVIPRRSQNMPHNLGKIYSGEQ